MSAEAFETRRCITNTTVMATTLIHDNDNDDKEDGISRWCELQLLTVILIYLLF
eukprot:m.15675 g.15675  ORF g.15675 m.15675 type:complete len:54 (-) comp4507_c0_seq1:131-292(-)